MEGPSLLLSSPGCWRTPRSLAPPGSGAACPVEVESDLPTEGINELILVTRTGEQMNETERVFVELVMERFDRGVEIRL